MVPIIRCYHWLQTTFKTFLRETSSRTHYEIVDLYVCKKIGFIKVVIKLSNRHTQDKYLREIILDNKLLKGFDQKTVRTLTYMATIEQLEPDYTIIEQHLTNEMDAFILGIKSRRSGYTLKKSPSEISKDKTLIARFNSIEANRIGYLAGVKETVEEYKLLKQL